MTINRHDLFNLTKTREGERQRAFAMRQNPTAMPHALPVQSDKASQRMRSMSGAYVERKRAPGEALPSTKNWRDGEAYNCPELRSQVRPGGLDFKACPSRGIG